ncbi:sugar phosphate isomerase/epimerase family protein [Lacticaseibacillus parakribbianus]|uniref:sugar phosphate isomerase/epimerase family protein n=1 Tax=Lacticaseibacillus parakribbianus TaxID=2970927 RepID=UPI0021CB48D7|nr:sugar phosphate isomerase/epimerase [Lacticaseibacillus parakribbianus]
MRLAAELFPVLTEFKQDPAQTLAALRRAGVAGLEMFGPRLMSAAALRNCTTQAGITITGYQVPWRLLQGTALAETIAYQKALGNHQVIIDALGGPWESGHKVSENTVAMWQSHAARINEIADELAKHGMRLTYHTHDYDYGELVEGVAPSLEILMKRVYSTVAIEVDSGNCIEGGADPVAWLRRLPGRAAFLHCKPFAHGHRYDVPFGSALDENDWPAILTAAQEAGTRWLVIEPESEKLGPALDQIAQGSRLLQGLLGQLG